MPYIGGVNAYRAKCADIAANGYTGFRLTAAGSAVEAQAAE
jgi:cyclohexanone monooxygenase